MFGLINKRIGYPKVKTYSIVSLIAVIISVCSFIFNFGIYRLIICITKLPLLFIVFYIILFFVSNYKYSKHSEYSEKCNILNILVYITYILAWILFPDYVDTVGDYVFFTLIKNNYMVDLCYLISPLLFVANFILIIVQLIVVKRIENRSINKSDMML